eukprot:scaffold4133_cov146-Amphora_coffeaeformis.AAC.9
MADEYEEQVEAAEEAGDTDKLLIIIASCAEHGGDEDWTNVAEGSLDAFYRLIKGGSNSKNDALGKIFASLEAWKEEEAIVEVALGCVVAVSSKKTKQVEDGINVSLIVDIMKNFEGESTIQEQACLAIEGLAVCSDAIKEKINAIDGIKDVLTASKDRITNERNKAYPGRAARALGLEL